MRAEVAYGKEQEKPASQPPPTDNVAIKLDMLEKDMQEIKVAICQRTREQGAEEPWAVQSITGT